MNSGTLVGSLIFAAVLAALIAFVISMMIRGWRHRGERQAALIGTLPTRPDELGAAVISTRGHYCGCALSPDWHERVTVGDLGFRSKAVLTRYPAGIMLQRSGASPVWIPQESITAIRTERGIAGKTVSRRGILVIRWRLPSGVEIDTGFQASNRSDYDGWLEELRS